MSRKAPVWYVIHNMDLVGFYFTRREADAAARSVSGDVCGEVHTLSSGMHQLPRLPWSEYEAQAAKAVH